MKISRVERDDGPRDEYPIYEDEHQDQDPPDVGCFMMGSTPDPSAPTERQPRRIDVAEDRQEFIKLVEERRRVQECNFGAYRGHTCLSVWMNHQDYVAWAMSKEIWRGAIGRGLALFQEWLFGQFAKESHQFGDREKSNRSAKLVQATLNSGRELTPDVRLYLQYKLDEREELLERKRTIERYQAEAVLHQRQIEESFEATRPAQPSSSGIQGTEVEQTDAEKEDRVRIGVAKRLQEMTRIEEEAAGILERKQINEREIIERQTRKLHERQLRQEKHWEKQRPNKRRRIDTSKI